MHGLLQMNVPIQNTLPKHSSLSLATCACKACSTEAGTWKLVWSSKASKALSRGCRRDVMEGLGVWHGKEEHTASIQMLASTNHGKQMSPAEYLSDQAYGWRCMISHLRGKAVTFTEAKLGNKFDISMSPTTRATRPSSARFTT